MVFLTHFVFAICTHKLFLSLAVVQRHLAASKQCFTAKLGFWEIQVDVLTSDVMAGAGGAVGPAQDVQYQPEGTVCHECHTLSVSRKP